MTDITDFVSEHIEIEHIESIEIHHTHIMASSSTKYNQAQEYIPNLSSYETGPAKTTAGSHRSDIDNKLDPRVDSDLNNRGQYAPGITTTTNSHPGATSYAANSQADNTPGPYGSDLNNKYDPHENIQSGEMTTKTANSEGIDPRKAPVNPGNNNINTNIDTTPTTTTDHTSGNPGHTFSSTFKPTSSSKPSTSGGVVGGTSTGAPAVPSPVSTPTGYSREQGRYNPATGMGYTPTNRQQQQAAMEPATAPQTTTSGGASGSKGVVGEIKGVVAGIHGAGESIRGSFNAAVDRTFNEPEGVAKNEAIQRQGEYETRSGQFSSSTKQKEGFNTQNQT
jgi:hypothetical protein